MKILLVLEKISTISEIKGEKTRQQKITIRFGLETALYYTLQLNFPEYKAITWG